MSNFLECTESEFDKALVKFEGELLVCHVLTKNIPSICYYDAKTGYKKEGVIAEKIITTPKGFFVLKSLLEEG